MEKQKKIFIKIQLEKNEETGELVTKTRFDPSAPNFFHNKDEICWCPTLEEITFLNEAFELIPTQKNKEIEKKTQPPVEKPESPEFNKNTVATEPTPQPLQPVAAKKTDADGIIVTADAAAVDEIIKKKRDGEGIIVEADEETIVDRVLKHKKKHNW